MLQIDDGVRAAWGRGRVGEAGWGGFREVTESEVEGEEALPRNAEVVREWGEGKK